MHWLKLFYFRADQHLLHSISSSHFDFITSFPHKKDEELCNFYAHYIHYIFRISLSQKINHLLPIVTYLPGLVYYLTNHDLKAPNLWKGYPTVLDLCNKNNLQLGTKMAWIEAHVMFTTYLAKPCFHHWFKILMLDPAIGHSQHHHEMAKFVNLSTYCLCFNC